MTWQVLNLCNHYMGAQESSRQDTENVSSGVDYYELLQVKEDASADEIKVSSGQHLRFVTHDLSSDLFDG